MSFTSYTFLGFAALVLLGYYLIPGKFQWLLLLGASYVFYLWNGGEYLAFILLTTVSTYLSTMVMGKRLEQQDAYLKAHKSELSKEDRKVYKANVKAGNRIWLIGCLVINFGVLAFCKGCLIDPLHTALKEGQLSFLTVGLPMGISFYLFQSMGYVLDVYRGTAKAEQNPLKLALFVSYFPQLVQGPISRFGKLTPALTTPHPFDGKQVSFGLQRMLWGYFKKMVIADRIAAAVIALRGPEYTGAGFLMLTLFYAIQIYGDFTGGIDITIGLSQALGIPLQENFRRPFFSKNIAEYWRRWHITLGEWMKDYIFYPISVSGPMRNLSTAARKRFPTFGKRLPVYVATVATWLATGIWHGFALNFVVWGMINCAIIIASEELAPLYGKFHAKFGFKEKRWYGCFEMLRMFVLMNLIRACDLFPDVGDYFRRIGSLFTTFNYHMLFDGTMLKLGLSGLDYGIIAAGCGVCFCVSLAQEKGSVRERLWNGPVWIRYGLTFVLLLAVLLMGSYGIGYDASNFIYNQF